MKFTTVVKIILILVFTVAILIAANKATYVSYDRANFCMLVGLFGLLLVIIVDKWSRE